MIFSMLKILTFESFSNLSNYNEYSNLPLSRTQSNQILFLKHFNDGCTLHYNRQTKDELFKLIFSCFQTESWSQG